MAIFKLADRVKETSATTGTGTLSLDGAAAGFQSFLSAVGNGGLCTFMTSDGTNWEIASGTLTSGSPNTLSRTLIASSSGSLISWATGSKNVALVQPAARISPVLLSTPVAYAATSPISFTALDSTYDEYELEFNNCTVSSNGASIGIRISIAAGFLTANYNYTSLDVDSGGGGAVPIGLTAQDRIVICGNVGNAATSSFSGKVLLPNPSNGVVYKLLQYDMRYISSGSNLFRREGAGTYVGAATAIDGIQVLASAGTISGQVLLKGKRNS